MTPSKTTSAVINKIRKMHLKPKARWIFIARRSAFWIFFALSAFFGAKAVALTIHIINSADVPMMFGRRFPAPPMLMHILPMFWIGSFVLFVIAASWFLQHTPKGYRWTLHKILGVNVLISIILGTVLYTTGIAPICDRMILSAFRPELSAEHHRRKLWNHPEHGFMRGKITEVYDQMHFVLEDPRGNEWMIEMGPESLRRGAQIAPDESVRVRGEVLEEGSFRADEVAPDMPPRFNRMGKMREGRNMRRW